MVQPRLPAGSPAGKGGEFGGNIHDEVTQPLGEALPALQPSKEIVAKAVSDALYSEGDEIREILDSEQRAVIYQDHLHHVLGQSRKGHIVHTGELSDDIREKMEGLSGEDAELLEDHLAYLADGLLSEDSRQRSLVVEDIVERSGASTPGARHVTRVATTRALSTLEQRQPLDSERIAQSAYYDSVFVSEHGSTEEQRTLESARMATQLAEKAHREMGGNEQPKLKP